jgi:hypothetical protein
MTSDYLLFRGAAETHERLAALTGCPEHMALAQELRRRAVDVRLGSLHPPQKCVECRFTIDPDEMQCRHCGRARQGVRLTREQVENLARFFHGYEGSAEKIEASQRAHLERRRGKRAVRRRGQFAGEGCVTTWADKVGVDPSTLRARAKRLGSLRAAVEHYSSGAWGK